MAKRQAVIKSQQKPDGFPWSPILAAVALIASIYWFWVYPHQRGEYKVRVEFDESAVK
jgi:hypothetical protein